MNHHEAINERSIGWQLHICELDILLADGSRPRPVLFSATNLETKLLSASEFLGDSQSVAIETLERMIVKYPRPAQIEIDEDLAIEKAAIRRWAREHRISVRFRPCKNTGPHDKTT
jgi:hypothetical protein